MDLYHLLLSPPTDGHPLLIFYHCVIGKDRTGLVTMSYFMKNGGYGNIVPQLSLHTRLHRNQPLSFQQALQATTQERLSKT